MTRSLLCSPALPVEHRNQAGGFGLAELMLALGLGLVISAAILQSLLVESRSGERLVERLRDRRLQQRALALVAADLRQATQLSLTPATELHGCNLAGRLVVLHLQTSAGPISYSLGAAPSGLWRGQVLMRCGPAYDLEGKLSPGSTSQNRVVIDQLATNAAAWPGCRDNSLELGESKLRGFSACLGGGGTALALRLQQADAPSGGTPLQTNTVLEWIGEANLSSATPATNAVPHP